MSETQNPFKTGQESITLEESPWNVTRTISIFVKHAGGKLSLYEDAECQGPEASTDLFTVKPKQSTGFYFYIAASSDQGTRFPNPAQNHDPVAWTNGSCPTSVTYGKVKTDFSAFSMSDLFEHPSEVSHGFDIIVDPGTGGPLLSTSQVDEIDPTILEKGEGPPSGM